MITKPTFGTCSSLRLRSRETDCVPVVGPDFTRRPVKYERFIRPMGLRYKKAHVTNPELKGELQRSQEAKARSASFLLPEGSRVLSFVYRKRVADSEDLNSNRSASHNISQEGNQPILFLQIRSKSLTRYTESAKSNVHTTWRFNKGYRHRSECQVALSCTRINSRIASNARVSELGMVTAGGKVVWGRYAQVTVRSIPLPVPTKYKH